MFILIEVSIAASIEVSVGGYRQHKSG